MPVFDSETYEANKAKIKTGGSYGAILKRMADDLKKSQRQDEVYDPETELPRLPEGEPPFPDGIPGLPPYNIMEFEEQEGDEEESKLVLIAQQTKEVEFEQQKDQAATRIVFESQPQLSGKFKRRKQKDKLDEEVEDFLRLLE